MKKANSLMLLFGIVSFGMSVLMPRIAFAICTGTYYATEFADGEPVTGYSLWTFSQDGSVVAGSNNEPAVPFGTSQGNWRPAGDNRIKSKTFNFSGPNPDLTPYPNVARVEAEFKFKNNCSGTVGGQSEFSVISCSVSDGPLCSPGFPIVTDALIELTRVSSN